jgi:phenylacetate-CoA ligase
MSATHLQTPLPVPHSAVEGVAWPAVAGGIPPLLLATLQQLEQSQWLPASELRARQFRQLGQLLAHAERAFSFYGPRLRDAGIKPGEPISDGQWAALPVLTRTEAQAAGEALHNRKVPEQHGEVTDDATTGSTGVALKVLKTGLTQFFWNAFTLREELWHGRDLAGKFAAIRRDDGRPADFAGPYATRFKNWGPPVASVYPTGPAAVLDIRCSIAQQVEWLREEAPDYLLTFGVNLLFLARHCREHGVALPSLRGVRSSGEVLSEEARVACRAAWGVEVVDMYSSVETGYIAFQCPRYPHYHVQSESALVEVIDDRGRPCEPGEVGQVVLTPLHNFAMPLLRYAIGDLAEVGEPCPCGRTLPVLRRVIGRTRDMLVLPSGEKRFPYYGQKALAEFGAVIQHQIVQRSLQEIAIRLVARRRLTQLEEEQLCTTVLSGLGHAFRVDFEYVDEIKREPGGKFAEFRCEVPD